MSERHPIREIAFHRNGIGGRSFWTVEFTVEELLSDVPVVTVAALHDLVGIVSAGSDPWDGVFVLSPARPSTPWRGDNFAVALRAAVEAAKAAAPADQWPPSAVGSIALASGDSLYEFWA